MEEPVSIYFVGTAGSGKSTMTNAFLEWMKQHGYDAITVNLDPGAEALPYAPDVDIREWLTLAEVMSEYGLGPNGAQIACADALALHVKKVAEVVEGFRTDYILYDTPGQIELFAFREASRLTVSALGHKRAVIAFLFDPGLAHTPAGFVSTLLLAATVQYRFYIPCVNLLSKADAIPEDEVEKIVNWGKDFDVLYDALTASEPGMHVESSIELLRALQDMGTYKELVPVSAQERTGFEDLYSYVQQSFAGGEDLETR